MAKYLVRIFNSGIKEKKINEKQIRSTVIRAQKVLENKAVGLH